MKKFLKYSGTLGLMFVACLCLGIGLKTSGISFGASPESTAVYISSGNYEMEQGTISDKEYGVYIDGGTFTMSGGTISDCSQYGVYLSSGTFNYSSGTISDEIYLGSGSYITLNKAPTQTLSIRLSSISNGSRVAYLSGISSLTATQLSYLNVVNMPSGYKLQEQSGYVVLVQNTPTTYYTITAKLLLPSLYGRISTSSGSRGATVSLSVPKGSSIRVEDDTIYFGDQYVSASDIDVRDYGILFQDEDGREPSGTVNESMTIYVYPYAKYDSSTFQNVKIGYAPHMQEENSNDFNTMWGEDIAYISLLMDLYDTGWGYDSLTQLDVAKEIIEASKHLMTEGYREWFPTRFSNPDYSAELRFYEELGSGSYQLERGEIDILLANSFTLSGFSDIYGVEEAQYGEAYGRYYVVFDESKGYEVVGHFLSDESSWSYPLFEYAQNKGVLTIGVDPAFCSAFSSERNAFGDVSDIFSYIFEYNANQQNNNFQVDIHHAEFIKYILTCDMYIVSSKNLTEFAQAQGDPDFERLTYLDFSATMLALFGDLTWNNVSDYNAFYENYHNYFSVKDGRPYLSSFQTRSAVARQDFVSRFSDLDRYMSTIAQIIRFSGEQEMRETETGVGFGVYSYYDGYNLERFSEISFKYSLNLPLNKEDIFDTKKYYKSPIVDRKNVA